MSFLHRIIILLFNSPESPTRNCTYTDYSFVFYIYYWLKCLTHFFLTPLLSFNNWLFWYFTTTTLMHGRLFLARFSSRQNICMHAHTLQSHPSIANSIRAAVFSFFTFCACRLKQNLANIIPNVVHGDIQSETTTTNQYYTIFFNNIRV